MATGDPTWRCPFCGNYYFTNVRSTCDCEGWQMFYTYMPDRAKIYTSVKGNPPFNDDTFDDWFQITPEKKSEEVKKPFKTVRISLPPKPSVNPGGLPSLPKAVSSEKSLNEMFEEIIEELTTPVKNPIKEPSVKGCQVCGGTLTYIRGRHPGEDNRKVCPTCLADRLDMIHEMSSPDYGVAKTSKYD